MSREVDMRITKLQQRIAEYDEQVRRFSDISNVQQVAIRRIRVCIEECEILAGRIASGSWDYFIDREWFDAWLKIKNDFKRWQRMFSESKHDFNQILAGFPIPEREDSVENFGNHVGERGEQGGSEEEHSTDSGETSDSVDD